MHDNLKKHCEYIQGWLSYRYSLTVANPSYLFFGQTIKWITISSQFKQLTVNVFSSINMRTQNNNETTLNPFPLFLLFLKSILFFLFSLLFHSSFFFPLLELFFLAFLLFFMTDIFCLLPTVKTSWLLI